MSNRVRKETIELNDCLKVIRENMEYKRPLGEKGKFRVEIKGIPVKVTSLRLRNFAVHGTDCEYCKLKGEFFAIEKSPNDVSSHINLYGVTDSGEEIVMTADHIKPVSKGGENRLINLQTLCALCNEDKDDKWNWWMSIIHKIRTNYRKITNPTIYENRRQRRSE